MTKEEYKSLKVGDKLTNKFPATAANSTYSTTLGYDYEVVSVDEEGIGVKVIGDKMYGFEYTLTEDRIPEYNNLRKIKPEKENKVFLGGTCAHTEWREELIPKLTISYFDPVVKDWTQECQQEEIRQKEICKWQLYTITPQMKGCFSIAEAVDGSNKDPKHTILCVLPEHQGKEWTYGETKSLDAVKNMVIGNGAIVCDTLDEVAEVLNKE